MMGFDTAISCNALLKRPVAEMYVNGGRWCPKVTYIFKTCLFYQYVV